ncbi:MAG: uroporphyrinogen-III C-methyltransferase [Candidatus Sumerlaeia bacterium]|nr:uroporphyrinogen-III C-methyltransferase [Candidatus Sumerlaeia bacterium]
MMTRQKQQHGVVHIVGAGPGDPGLITVRGLECLRACDAVVYDHLAQPSLLDAVPASAERIYVGKQAGRHTLRQPEINRLLVRLARAGKRVVRLKGGDPFIFGRGGEEAEALAAAGVAYEVVPGVTAALGASAYAGMPLTHRDFASSVTFVTGHEDPTQNESDIPWEMLGRGGGTLVFYMGVGRLDALCGQLLLHGRAGTTPAAVVEWATLPRQRTVTGTLATIAQRAKKAGIHPPALLIVGAIVPLRKKLAWFEKRPLFGRRIVVTRSRTQASELRERLERLGAEVIEFPTIRLVPPRSERRLRDAARHLNRYDWLIFTSANAVERFCAIVLEENGGDIRAFGRARIAAIGPATRQAVERFRLAVALQPARYVAEEVVAALAKTEILDGLRVLIPRAEVAREVLPERLRKAGARVDVIPVYRTVPDKPVNAREIVKELLAGKIDTITFTSSSTVENFVRAVGRKNFARFAGKTKIASIGPVTSKTLRDYGACPAIEARDYTIEGLVRAIKAQR